MNRCAVAVFWRDILVVMDEMHDSNQVGRNCREPLLSGVVWFACLAGGGLRIGLKFGLEQQQSNCLVNSFASKLNY